ncbi:MAG: 50S ribosomal protein L6 [Acidobacteriota bacterium]
MSRIGNKIISVPSGVQVQIKDSRVEVKGPKGLIHIATSPRITIEKGSEGLVCKRASEQKSDRALHGTMRALIANAVKGVTDGFKKDFEIVGIGYRAAIDKKKLVFTVGYSHPVEIELPEDLQVTFDEKNKNKFTLHGVDKQKVGQFAAHIRNVRPPDPYKGKGIKYAEERLKLKEGKKKA